MSATHLKVCQNINQKKLNRDDKTEVSKPWLLFNLRNRYMEILLLSISENIHDKQIVEFAEKYLLT